MEVCGVWILVSYNNLTCVAFVSMWNGNKQLLITFFDDDNQKRC